MPITEFACPTCLAAGAEVHLVQSPGKFGLYCSANSAHIFQDTEEFLASNPKKLAMPKPAQKIQPGVEPFIVKIPTGLIEMLGKRFGTKLDVSVAALLAVMTDSQSFVVVGEDIKRLNELLSAKIANAENLVGHVYNLWVERNQFRQQAEQKSGGASGVGDLPEMDGDFVQTAIRINIDAYTAIREKAKFNGMSFSQYVQQVLSIAVQNSWI
jgi:hypothetical protein